MDVDWSFLLDHTKPSFEDQFAEWLYGDYDEQKYKDFKMLYAIGPVHDYIDYLFDKRDDAAYLARHGMDYSDIRDPRNLKATSSGSRVLGNSYRMISRNVDKLYR